MRNYSFITPGAKCNNTADYNIFSRMVGVMLSCVNIAFSARGNKIIIPCLEKYIYNNNSMPGKIL